VVNTWLKRFVVNTWLKRYQEQGLAGLQIKTGRGRTAILNQETDLAAVRQSVQNNRQRVSLAKADLQQRLGKEFSVLILKRFLKNGCRFKRVRRGRKHKPNTDVYEFKCECLAELEQLSEQGQVDLFYGDESGVSLMPCVLNARSTSSRPSPKAPMTARVRRPR
jgi:hypothetical protein